MSTDEGASKDQPEPSETKIEVQPLEEKSDEADKPSQPSVLNLLAMCICVVIGWAWIIETIVACDQQASLLGGCLPATLFVGTSGRVGALVRRTLIVSDPIWQFVRVFAQTIAGIGFGVLSFGGVAVLLDEYLGVPIPFGVSAVIGAVVMGAVCFVKPDALEWFADDRRTIWSTSKES